MGCNCTPEQRETPAGTEDEPKFEVVASGDTARVLYSGSEKMAKVVAARYPGSTVRAKAEGSPVPE